MELRTTKQMLYLGFLLLMVSSARIGLCNEVTEEPEISFQQVILRENIFKDQPKTTYMYCDFKNEIERCTWTLGPLGRSLSSLDPEETMSRHKVELSNVSDSCLLTINDINFGDEGFYECNFDDDPPKFRWQLVIQGNPGSPVISYTNGTIIWADMIAIDETPVTINLRCTSTGAKPKHKKIYWMIDGEVADESRPAFTGPVGYLWQASSDMTITFDEEDEYNFTVKRVSCVTEHATGKTKQTKIFGIRNTNDTIYLVHYELPNSDRGQLKCETDMFPAPSIYEIVRIIDHPYQGDPTHLGQEMYVKHDGRYVCRAGVEIYRSASGHERNYSWLESNMVEIGDDTEYLISAALPTFNVIWKTLQTHAAAISVILLLLLNLDQINV